MSRLRSSFYFASVTRLKVNRYPNEARFLSTSQKKDNHYEVLDVSRGSSQSEIKDAYYKLSKEYHPDRNPGDDNASDKFRKITEAYDVLSNVDAKREYDRSLTLKDTKSSPYSSNYRASPTFREINRNTGKPNYSEDYTQFYKHRQAQLGRNHPASSLKREASSAFETTEDAVNPFNHFVDPQPPPIKAKSYKQYSQSGWEDPGKNEPDSGWILRGDMTTQMVFSVVAIILGLIFQSSGSSTPVKYCVPPKS